jgi:hypothetical protein
LRHFPGFSRGCPEIPKIPYPEGEKYMARPITPTPVLRGKEAERFIRKLEAEKNIPAYPSAKKADMKTLRTIVAEIEQRKQ